MTDELQAILDNYKRVQRVFGLQRQVAAPTATAPRKVVTAKIPTAPIENFSGPARPLATEYIRDIVSGMTAHGLWGAVRTMVKLSSTERITPHSKNQIVKQICAAFEVNEGALGVNSTAPRSALVRCFWFWRLRNEQKLSTEMINKVTGETDDDQINSGCEIAAQLREAYYDDRLQELYEV